MVHNPSQPPKLMCWRHGTTAAPWAKCMLRCCCAPIILILLCPMVRALVCMHPQRLKPLMALRGSAEMGKNIGCKWAQAIGLAPDET